MNNAQTVTEVKIRPIRKSDIIAVANIIRDVMTEFGAVGCGYSINDAEVDDMYTAYSPEGSEFYVLELGGDILGCGGFAPLAGGDDEICELRKMYFLSQLRGTGMGRALLKLCLDRAAAHGYRRCYLETMDGMEQARKLYEKHGFRYLDKPMGNTGHTSCGTWMAREL
jgi:putative acetyltransferase